MASDDNNIRVVNLSDLKKIVGGSDDIEEMLKNLGDSSGSTRYYENPSTPVTCSKCSSSNLSFQGIESLKCKFKCLDCVIISRDSPYNTCQEPIKELKRTNTNNWLTFINAAKIKA